tara:strand:+ start:1059 stop:2561 length:1503 start_codon:yes stop_codon:yes gene_type:complete
MESKLINSLSISTSAINKNGENRYFSVSGEPGAKFSLRVQHTSTVTDPSKEFFYNFADNNFPLAQTQFDSESVLTVEMRSKVYNGTIAFPSSAGTYTFMLLPEGNTLISSGKQIISKQISQGENVTVTIATGTENTDTYGQSASLGSTSNPAAANVTSVGQAGGAASSTVSNTWSVFNKKSDANGFGLIITNSGKVTDKDFYYPTTETVNRSSITEQTDTVDGSVSSSTAVTLDTSYLTTGIQVGDYVFGTGVTYGTTVAAVNVGSDVKDITLSAAMSISDGVTLTFITPSNEVVVDDLTDLVVGMQLYYLTSTTKPSVTTIIKGINTDTKTLSLSSNQALSDGLTMTFRAYGFSLINSVLGALFEASNNSSWSAKPANEVFSQLRAAVSNTNVTITTTYGIAGGSLINFDGANVKNTATNNVNVVTPDPDGSDADGLFTCDVAQAFAGKEKLRFFAKSNAASLCTQCDIYFSLVIKRYPSANKTIYLDLDRFITPGTAS